MGRLTTHVLDTARGMPGSGIVVELFEADAAPRLVASATTNADGRCDAPLLDGEAMRPGVYELVFHAGSYFRRLDVALPEPPFVDKVVIRFGVADGSGHYHVPLLLSPFGYTTYRGS